MAYRFCGFVGKIKRITHNFIQMLTFTPHLAASASVHLSPEVMGALSAAAFRSRGRRCHFETWGFDFQYCYTSEIVQDRFCRSSSDVRGCTQQVVSDVLTPAGRLRTWCVSIKRCHPEFCGREMQLHCVAEQIKRETERERQRTRKKEREREKRRAILPLQWWLTGRDGGSLMVGPVCDFVMSNWGSEDHLFMTLRLYWSLIC